MRNIQEPPKVSAPIITERKITQDDIDFIDEQYKERAKLYDNFINTPPINPLLEQYKKNLVKEPVFEKETIVYDTATRKWKLVKEKELK
jgi:hypothetical protein